MLGSLVTGKENFPGGHSWSHIYHLFDCRMLSHPIGTREMWVLTPLRANFLPRIYSVDMSYNYSLSCSQSKIVGLKEINRNPQDSKLLLILDYFYSVLNNRPQFNNKCHKFNIHYVMIIGQRKKIGVHEGNSSHH